MQPSQARCRQGCGHERGSEASAGSVGVSINLEDDPQQLFTEASLHGLGAPLCDDVDALDSYLPPHAADLVRKVAEVMEVPQPAPA
ncbi:hypothetical protein [Streptomyces mirabilis]|uniref:hypothetical protein n=1 Tax=Streptomyces mirabilis TaxID=68239 RepID=UPI0036962534